MKTMLAIKLSLITVVITMLVASLTTSCTPDDGLDQKPIRYFPVKIITVDCDPSDIIISKYDEYNNIVGEENPNSPYKDAVYYDISKVIEVLNENYASSRIQFYSYGEIAVKSFDEYYNTEGIDYWSGYNPRWDGNQWIGDALVCAFIYNDSYWADETNKRKDDLNGAHVGGLGGGRQAQIAIHEAHWSSDEWAQKYNGANLSGNGGTVRHEFDHVFGWQHSDIRNPQNLYDYSFNSSLNPLASDRPL